MKNKTKETVVTSSFAGIENYRLASLDTEESACGWRVVLQT